jgi:hypothetical protein
MSLGAPLVLLAVAAGPLFASSPAHAQPPAQPAPKAAAQGVAVLAMGAPSDAAALLAREVYANDKLKPAALDEATSRSLLGDAPPDGAPKELRDLAELRAGVKGDDAASRQLLAAIAHRLGVRGVLVVEAPSDHGPSARLFLAESGEMDAARYEPDAAGSKLGWSSAVRSVARGLGSTVMPAPAPAPLPPASARAPSGGLAVKEGPHIDNTPPGARHFYESPWFWGAIGAALFVGGATYFATRDNGSNTIHLQLQVPH